MRKILVKLHNYIIYVYVRFVARKFGSVQQIWRRRKKKKERKIGSKGGEPEEGGGEGRTGGVRAERKMGERDGG